MSGKEYVSLSISAPELGSKTLYANLGRAAGEIDPNVYALIWNPRETKRTLVSASAPATARRLLAAFRRHPPPAHPPSRVLLRSYALPPGRPDHSRLQLLPIQSGQAECRSSPTLVDG